MTSPKVSPETIRTERAFQIYLALLNKDHQMTIKAKEYNELDKDLSPVLRAFVNLSYQAADEFMNAEFINSSDDLDQD